MPNTTGNQIKTFFSKYLYFLDFRVVRHFVFEKRETT